MPCRFLPMNTVMVFAADSCWRSFFVAREVKALTAPNRSGNRDRGVPNERVQAMLCRARVPSSLGCRYWQGIPCNSRTSRAPTTSNLTSKPHPNCVRLSWTTSSSCWLSLLLSKVAGMSLLPLPVPRKRRWISHTDRTEPCQGNNFQPSSHLPASRENLREFYSA